MHSNNSALVTFYDKVNLREAPSTDSKILASLDEGIRIQQVYITVKDTINGKHGYWYKVKYKGNQGYIWGELLANCSVKSQENVDQSFIFNNKGNKTLIKHFNKGKFQTTISIKNPDTLKFSSAKSLGSTWQSNGKDVFLFYYGDYKKSTVKFYTWNNQQFTPYNFPFKDSSFFNYHRSKYQLITEKLVNMRTQPDINSSVIKVLNLGTKVGISRRKIGLDTLEKKQVGYWSRVSVGSDTGYIWDSYISVYHFNSYKEKDLIFLLREPFGYKSQVLALKDDKVIDTFSFRRISNFYGGHTLGTMGLDNIQEIIGFCYSGESCGVPSGDVLIAWKNNRFSKLVNDYGIGDGGLSYNHNAIFPSEKRGEKGIIKISESDSESIDLYSEKGENNYDGIYEHNLMRNYSYLNDELKEIPSETTKMESLLASEFKNYQLNYFEKGDFNKDGIQDVILYAIDTFESRKESYYKRKDKALIVVALGDGFWNYNIVSSSKKLINYSDNRPLTKIEETDKGFCVKIFYSGYYNNFPMKRHFYMYYNYSKKKQDFLLTRTTEFFPPENYSGDWSKKEYYYRKKPIALGKSYHSDIEN